MGLYDRDWYWKALDEKRSGSSPHRNPLPVPQHPVVPPSPDPLPRPRTSRQFGAGHAVLVLSAVVLALSVAVFAGVI